LRSDSRDKDEVSADEPVRMRLEKWRVLIPACLLAPFLAYVLYVSLRRDADPLGLELLAICLLGGLCVVINFLWLDYLEVNDRAVRRVQCLGLLRKEIPVGLLRGVRKGSMTPLWFSYDSLRFRSIKSTIEVPYEVYGKTEVTRGLHKLSNAGVEVDQSLSKEFRLD